MNEPNSSEAGKLSNFTKRVWITCAIVAFFVIFIWLFIASIKVLFLIFAGSLIAIYFNRFAALIRKKTNISPKASVAVSMIGTILIIGLIFWFIGAKIQTQLAALSETLPATIENAKGQLAKSDIGKRLIESSKTGGKDAMMFASRFFQSSFGALGDLYIILFIAIFFTLSPARYVNGILALLPYKAEPKAREVLAKAGLTLGNWLKGQLFAMTVVAILTLIALSIIGIPMALALAIIAGLLNFIPNFGPLIAMVPAVLVGLMEGPTTALIVAATYIAIQTIESNLITPTVQNRLINMPPALILIGQLFMGALTGAWGIILATPVVAVIIVVIKEVYLKEKKKPIETMITEPTKPAPVA